MFTDNITISQSIFVSIFSMLVVFIVLLIISYVVDLVAFFIMKNSIHKK